jgi:hypothetical protein
MIEQAITSLEDAIAHWKSNIEIMRKQTYTSYERIDRDRRSYLIFYHSNDIVYFDDYACACCAFMWKWDWCPVTKTECQNCFDEWTWFDTATKDKKEIKYLINYAEAIVRRLEIARKSYEKGENNEKLKGIEFQG